MKQGVKCSFCGRDNVQVIESECDGKTVYICKDCAGLALDLFNKIEHKIENDENFQSSHVLEGEFDTEIPKPKQIKEFLDQYIIGQDRVKEKIAVAVYNHYKRINYKDDNVELDKSNIILCGPTGTGKTLIARTIAKMLNVPFAIADATVLTESGYVGEDVESVLVRLYQAADYDVARTERGIVFIDEIDKIARKNGNPSITRDVSGEGVQQGLLKLLEDSIVSIPPKGGRKHPDQPLVQINTKNILFICAGAFIGLEDKIKHRCNKSTIGFDATSHKKVNDDNYMKYLSALDLKSFGLIPEILGRLPIITYTDELDKSALKRILTEPKNALVKQYQELFKMDNIELTFTDKALDLIVEHTIENKLGARGLRGVMEQIMNKAMFELPSDDKVHKLNIDPKYVKKQLK